LSDLVGTAKISEASLTSNGKQLEFDSLTVHSYYENGLNDAICTNPLSWTTDTIFCIDTLNRGGVLLNFQKVIPAICAPQGALNMLAFGPTGTMTATGIM